MACQYIYQWVYAKDQKSYSQTFIRNCKKSKFHIDFTKKDTVLVDILQSVPHSTVFCCICISKTMSQHQDVLYYVSLLLLWCVFRFFDWDSVTICPQLFLGDTKGFYYMLILHVTVYCKCITYIYIYIYICYVCTCTIYTMYIHW